MIPYLTIEQSIIKNAERHKTNAEKYLLQNNLHHAIGSYRKMLKNYEKVEKIQIPKEFNSLVNQLANNVADAILSGNK